MKQKILKSTLLLRKLGNKTYTIWEQNEETEKLYANDETALDNWIESMKEELSKAKEQRELEAELFRQELSYKEAMGEFAERKAERDEWDDYWNDVAKSVGAIPNYF